PGADNDLPPIVIGSHLDSVEKGGRFDGVLGVLTGLEVVQTMKDNDIKPQMPIVIANITNEEGARFEPAMMASVSFQESLIKQRCLNRKIRMERRLAKHCKQAVMLEKKKTVYNKQKLFWSCILNKDRFWKQKMYKLAW